jgi:hypothetical protein
VTIYSQQIRALNIVYSLFKSGIINSKSKVAVIGGGVGGMTAAVALGSLNCSVSIFERQSELLHLFKGCHTRYLHPNVYDWPEKWASDPKTDLPFMNWSAASADEVAETLLSEWKDHAARLPITVYLSRTVMVRGYVAGMRRVTIISPKLEELSFNVVLLCVGFGLEKTIRPQPLRSYWRDDSLHQPELGPHDRRTHYLLSGNGDGGLIDLLRLRLRDFQHEKLLQGIEGEHLRPLKEQLIAIEDSSRDALTQGREREIGWKDDVRRLSKTYCSEPTRQAPHRPIKR